MVSLGVARRRAAPSPGDGSAVVLSRPIAPSSVAHAPPQSSPAPLRDADSDAEAPPSPPPVPVSEAFNSAAQLERPASAPRELVPLQEERQAQAPQAKPFAPPRLEPTPDRSGYLDSDAGGRGSAVFYQQPGQPGPVGNGPERSPLPGGVPAPPVTAGPGAAPAARGAPHARLAAARNSGVSFGPAVSEPGPLVTSGGPARDTTPPSAPKAPAAAPAPAPPPPPCGGVGALKPAPYRGQIFGMPPAGTIQLVARIEKLSCSQPGDYRYTVTGIDNGTINNFTITTYGEKWVIAHLRSGENYVIQSAIPLDKHDESFSPY
jgi:hypothetical protein